MKKLLAIPILMMLLIKPLWPIAAYVINYDYIVTHLCVNKNRPQLQCDGKCYLAALLTKESEQNQENPFARLLISELPLILQTETTSHLKGVQFLLSSKNVPIGYMQNLHTFLFISRIIQPPEHF